MSRLFKKGRFSTLYVGLDESNHHSYRGEEIIVAVFSFDPYDVKNHLINGLKDHRDYDEMGKWLQHRRREYLFTLWPNGKEQPQIPSYLAKSAPYLISEFLKMHDRYHPEIEKISLHLDGKLDLVSRNFLESSLNRRLQISFVINEHPKGKRSRTINYPKIVEIADTLSNYLYRLTLGEGFNLKNLPHYVHSFTNF